MNAWTEQADGSYLGVASERAIQFADKQPHRQSALAALGFAGWCRDMNLDPFWVADDPHVVALNDFGVVEVLLDNTFPFNDPDTFTVGAAEGDKWYAVVRVIPSGGAVVIHILGLSATLDQIQRDVPPHHRHRLLSCREWLRAFPPHQVPYTEEAA